MSDIPPMEIPDHQSPAAAANGAGDPKVEKLLSQLKTVYSKKDKVADFDKEESVFRHVLPALIDQLENANFQIQEPFAIGSTATVWLVNDDQLNQQRALKLPRPRSGRVRDIVSVIRAERARLASLGHPNIIKIYHAGELETQVSGDEYAFPYFVMDFLKGVEDLDVAIIENLDKLSAMDIIGYFHDVLMGLAFLHGKEIVHCDVKPGNLLIAPGYGALIADLGYAKNISRLSRPSEEFTDVTHTPKWAHPDLVEAIYESTDSNATRSKISGDKLKPQFDLYAFGRTMQHVLVNIRRTEAEKRQRDGAARSKFSPYQWQYLETISRRLLDGCVVVPEGQEDESDVIPGLPAYVMKEICYRDTAEALEDIQKLLSLYDLEGAVPELNPNIASYVQIPLGKVPLTDRVGHIITHPTFVRLNQATQLGFVSLVYPGASHSRAEHVQGTFAGACDFIRALWYDESNCLFRSVMRQEDIEAALLAALLHDIGQYAMAHDLTEICNQFAHERFTRAMLERNDSRGSTSMARLVEWEWSSTLEDLLGVLEVNESSTFRQRVLHSIINGPLDCDKLDYLRRDSVHLGVAFGHTIDRDRLLRNLTVAYAKTARPYKDVDGSHRSKEVLAAAEVAINEKALAAARSVWSAREDMHTQVYWHHSVRALKAMLAYAVRDLIIALKTEDEKEKFWTAFGEFVVAGVLPKCPVPSPPPNEAERHDYLETTASSLVDGWSILSPSDDRVIEFLNIFATPRSSEMLGRIRRRELYRRVAVRSAARESAYEAIYGRLRAYRNNNQFDMIEEWRSRAEVSLANELMRGMDAAEITHYKKGDEVLELDKLEQQLATCVPLLLFDVPIKGISGVSTSDRIWYLPEDIAGVHNELPWFPSFAHEDLSYDQSPFDRRVGKIRVFVHPEWSDLVARYLSREDILGFFE